jgi:hypothetical protein
MPFWKASSSRRASSRMTWVKQLLELVLTRGELMVADLRFSSTNAIWLALSLVSLTGQGVPKLNYRRVWTGSLEPHFFTQNSQNYFFVPRLEGRGCVNLRALCP